MKKPIKKQKADNIDFVNVWENIEQVVSKTELDNLIDKSVSDIRKQTRGKRAGFGWSGGKDSIALQVVCEAAGIDLCVLGMSSKLEYKAFLEWVSENKPAGLWIWDSGLGDEFLLKSPHMVFPTESKHLARWYAIQQHVAQAKFFEQEKLDILILGRRGQDGNYTGGRGKNIYTNRQGVTRFSPIVDWRHEHCMAAVHYYKGGNLPPFYQYANGWVYGSGAWPAKMPRESKEQCWAELREVEPDTFSRLAPHFIEAQRAING